MRYLRYTDEEWARVEDLRARIRSGILMNVVGMAILAVSRSTFTTVEHRVLGVCGAGVVMVVGIALAVISAQKLDHHAPHWIVIVALSVIMVDLVIAARLLIYN